MVECDLCKHERREEFEDLLASGKMYIHEVAAIINSKMCTVLQRIKNHSGKTMEKKWPVKNKDSVKKNN